MEDAVDKSSKHLVNKIMENQGEKRLSYIDAAKGIGILLIALGHISYVSNPVVTYGNSFKLAIFYIIAGYLFSLKKDVKKGTYIYSRLKKLGIPYVFFSIIAIAYAVIRALLRGNSIASALSENVYMTITLRGIGVLWFLPSLFIAEIIFVYLIRHCNKIVRIIVLIAMPLICCGLIHFFDFADINISEYYIPLVILKAIVAAWFYSIGYYCLEFLINLPIVLLIVFAGVNVYLSLLNTGVDLNNFGLGKYPLYFFISGVIGSIIVIRLLKELSKHIGMRALCFCGKYSLFIMATHIYIYYILVSLSRRIIIFESANLGYYVFLVATLAITFIIDAIIIYCWEHIKKGLRKKSSRENFVLNVLKYI